MKTCPQKRKRLTGLRRQEEEGAGARRGVGSRKGSAWGRAAERWPLGLRAQVKAPELPVRLPGELTGL